MKPDLNSILLALAAAIDRADDRDVKAATVGAAALIDALAQRSIVCVWDSDTYTLHDPISVSVNGCYAQINLQPPSSVIDY